MTNFIRTGLFVVGCTFSFTASAFEIAQEFSAEAVQSTPGRPSMNVKMFISKKAVRTESTMNGNTVVEIVYPKDKRPTCFQFCLLQIRCIIDRVLIN